MHAGQHPRPTLPSMTATQEFVVPRSMPMTSLARSTAPVLRHDGTLSMTRSKGASRCTSARQTEAEKAYVNALMSSPMELQVLDVVCTYKHKQRQANHAAMRMF